MRIIGLTGGIACGKSTISLTLKSLGATIIDGDQLSRALTQPGGLALPAIRAEFGSEVFHADGTLDRRALGSLIFASDERRHALDDLMQPLLREMIEREILRAKEGGAKICVLDMPLLYEAGLDGLCNTVWCASLPRETQLARLMAVRVAVYGVITLHRRLFRRLPLGGPCVARCRRLHIPDLLRLFRLFRYGHRHGADVRVPL